jgi:hypothetical protein
MVSQTKRRTLVAKHCAIFAAACGLSMWLPTQAMADDAASAPTASAPAAATPSSATVDTENGKVSYIDQSNAIIVVTITGGQQISFNAKEHRDVLAKVKVGDQVSIRYQEPYVTELAHVKGTPLTRLTRTVKITAPDASAANSDFSAVRTYQGVAQITKVDTKLNMLTIVDKSGNARSIQVSDPALLKTMQTLKRHEHVRISYDSVFSATITH